jgi:hypothetical protein
MYVFNSYHLSLSLTCVFSPGIIHGAHRFLPISPDLTRAYSIIYYPQILRPKERGVISCLVCFARRYLVVLHVNLSWECLLQVPLSVVMHYGIFVHDNRPHCHNRTTPYTSGFFQSASSFSPSDDPLSPSSSSLSCSLNWWIMRAPTIQVFCRFSSSLRSFTSSPLASG